MTQHTEGPWIVSGTLKAGDDFEYVNADGPVVIARIHSPGLHPNTPDPTATCAANARLIAAAPELLEVLRSLVTAVTITPSQWDAARATITRATQGDNL